MDTAQAGQSNPLEIWKKAAILVVIGTLTSELIACRSDRDHWHRGHHALVSENLEERHPIEISKRSVQIALPISSESSGLSTNQRQRLRNYLTGYLAQGNGPLLVQAPIGSSNEDVTIQAIQTFRDIASETGVPKSNVNWQPYHSSSGSGAPIKLAYRAYKAHPPECGIWPDDMARDDENRPYAEFGCATQQNLAVAIENPRDLVHPRGQTPRSSERRSVTWDKYVKGESVISEQSPNEAGAISDIASGGGG